VLACAICVGVVVWAKTANLDLLGQYSSAGMLDRWRTGQMSLTGFDLIGSTDFIENSVLACGVNILFRL